jgi:RNA polymerase sigma factor (sigma-70 family)
MATATAAAARQGITREWEQELAARIGNGDTAAVWALAELAMPVIIREAKVYRTWGRVEFAALIDAGKLGAAQAATRFHPDRGTFFAFAKFYIRAEVQDYARQFAGPVVVEKDAWKGRRGREADTVRGLAWMDAASVEELTEAEMGAPIDHIDDDLELVAMLARLTENQRAFIRLAGSGMTGKEIAVEMGVTEAAVSKLKARAHKSILEIIAARVN